MKEVVWTFPYWIDNFPGLGSLIWKARHLKWLFALHFGIWLIVAKVLYIPRVNGLPMLEGFTISTILMFVYYYWLSLPYSLSFDKPSKQLVISKGTSEGGGRVFSVLYKSPWQDKYSKKNKRVGENIDTWKIGVVVDAEKYNQYKKEGKIDDATLEDLAYRKRHLGGEDKVQSNAPFDVIVNVSFYLLIVLYSAAIIIAKVDKKMFRMLFPWIILSTLFLLIQSGVWVADPTVQKSVLTFIIKRQLFILGLSFALTGVLIVLKLNNR
jgi:hypothetical protein